MNAPFHTNNRGAIVKLVAAIAALGVPLLLLMGALDGIHGVPIFAQCTSGPGCWWSSNYPPCSQYGCVSGFGSFPTRPLPTCPQGTIPLSWNTGKPTTKWYQCVALAPPAAQCVEQPFTCETANLYTRLGCNAMRFCGTAPIKKCATSVGNSCNGP
jgi:hypothetical protein